MTTVAENRSSYYKFSNTTTSQIDVFVKKNSEQNGKILHPPAKVAKKLTIIVLDEDNQPLEDAFVVLGKGSVLSTINLGQGTTDSQGKITFNVNQYPMKNVINITKKYYQWQRREIDISSQEKQLFTFNTRTISPQEIINLMKKNSWHRGAKNLQEWVDRIADERDPKDSARKWAYNDPSRILRINFEDIINNFERARLVYDRILRGSLVMQTEVVHEPFHPVDERPVAIHGTPTWKNAKSKGILKKIVLRMEEQFSLITTALSSPNTKVKFGDLDAPIQEINSPKDVDKDKPNEDERVKSKGSTRYASELVTSRIRDIFIKDDLTVALANFVIPIAAEGYLIADQQRNVTLHITQIGLYIQDSFDFIDDSNDFGAKIFGSQPLGSWDPNTGELSNLNYGALNADSIYVDNQFFNLWRKENNKGGDYVIYSNIHKIPVSMIIDIGKF